MTEKKNGGPAFPISNNDVITEVIKHGNHPEGMSLRDYFAAKAMEGMIMTQTYNDDAIAKYAYKIADAMLKAREE